MTGSPRADADCAFRCGACEDCLRCAGRLAETPGTQVLLIAPCVQSPAAPAPAPGDPPRLAAVVLCGGAAMAAVEWFTTRRGEAAAAQQAAARAAHERLRALRGREVHGV